MKTLRTIAIAFAVFLALPAVKAEAARNFRSRVSNIAASLEPVIGLKVRVAVVSDDGRDACVLPDGTIMITSGFEPLLESDDELAFILAHEMSHVLAKDHLRTVPELAGVKGMPSGQLSEMYADINAVNYVKKAGYDPGASLKVLRRIAPSSKTISDRLEFLTGYLETSVIKPISAD